jgi:hypothetical protein
MTPETQTDTERDDGTDTSTPPPRSPLSPAEYKKVIQAADATYKKLKDKAKDDFLTWLPVARGLFEIRLKAFEGSNSRDVLSKPYRDELARELSRTTHLRNMDSTLRKVLTNIGQHEDDIIAWWEERTEDEQAAWSSPQTVWKNYKGDGGKGRRRAKKAKPAKSEQEGMDGDATDEELRETLIQAPLNHVRIQEDHRAVAAEIGKIVDTMFDDRIRRHYWFSGFITELVQLRDRDAPQSTESKPARKPRGKKADAQ